MRGLLKAWIALSFVAPAMVTAQGDPPPPDGGPKGDPRAWFTPLDYPAALRGTGAHGNVSVMLDVDTAGHVGRCRVTVSSGYAALDQTTCWLVQRRGRFFVRNDANGKPEGYSYALDDIAWRAPASGG